MIIVYVILHHSFLIILSLYFIYVPNENLIILILKIIINHVYLIIDLFIYKLNFKDILFN